MKLYDPVVYLKWGLAAIVFSQVERLLEVGLCLVGLAFALELINRYTKNDQSAS